MKAYYNENDPYPAQWLRNLVKGNMIADGDVDERSIEEVKAKDLEGYTQAHFFGGIGIWSYALREAGFPDSREVWTGSCPCSPFSTAGLRKGTSDPRHLWPTWFKLIKKRQPGLIFGEQVSSSDGLAWLDIVQTDLEKAGYSVQAFDLCASGFGAPHKRQRLYIVAVSKRERQKWGTKGRSPGEREIPEATDKVKRPSEPDNLEDPDNRRFRRPGLSVLGREAPEQDAVPPGGSEIDNVADATGSGHERQQTTTEPPGRPGTQCGSGPGSLADTECTAAARQRGDRGEVLQKQETGRSGPGREPHDLGDPEDRDQQGLRECGKGTEGSELEARGPGPVNGYWSDAEWVFCRDGKYRAVKPGILVLASKYPNRVPKLRAAGNSLTASVAIEFIKTYLAFEKSMEEK